MTYVLSSARLDATGHRWVSELANYDITIYYRPGRVNTNADVLSRLPNAAAAQDFTDLRYLEARLKNEVVEPDKSIGIEVTKDVLLPVSVQEGTKPTRPDHEPLVTCLSMGAEAVPEDYEFPKVTNMSSPVDWKMAQAADPAIKSAVSWVKTNRKPSRRAPKTPEGKDPCQRVP